ncbi:hypothetical protein ABID92_000450 [Frigoribacterium sp. PvP120]|uniref:hypothetical protein n=1 Tax=unclassified Frigoribacterium TaxID=2627005 RepID=UPI001AE206E4|nr:hypothetical protein [Frigoribacterium sp. PvP121]MBP1241722.1 hypothetical protein [Frigoribacterium sp. PvP121]
MTNSDPFENNTGRPYPCTREGCLGYGKTHRADEGESSMVHIAFEVRLDLESERAEAAVVVDTDDDTGPWVVCPTFNGGGHSMPLSDFELFEKVTRRGYLIAQRLNEERVDTKVSTALLDHQLLAFEAERPGHLRGLAEWLGVPLSSDERPAGLETGDPRA